MSFMDKAKDAGRKILKYDNEQVKNNEKIR